MKNPIFIEYYSHEGCDCYKVLIPWSRFNQEKIVLCRVEEGIDRARTIARDIIVARLDCSLAKTI
jgi:hypothetical protein